MESVRYRDRSFGNDTIAAEKKGLLKKSSAVRTSVVYSGHKGKNSTNWRGAESSNWRAENPVIPAYDSDDKLKVRDAKISGIRSQMEYESLPPSSPTSAKTFLPSETKSSTSTAIPTSPISYEELNGEEKAVKEKIDQDLGKMQENSKNKKKFEEALKDIVKYLKDTDSQPLYRYVYAQPITHIPQSAELFQLCHSKK